MLFKINEENKEEFKGKLNIKKLITNLKAKELTMFKRSYKTYGDILLANIEKWKWDDLTIYLT